MTNVGKYSQTSGIFAGKTCFCFIPTLAQTCNIVIHDRLSDIFHAFFEMIKIMERQQASRQYLAYLVQVAQIGA